MPDVFGANQPAESSGGFPLAKTVRILGIHFFDGSAEEAVERLCSTGGYVVVPAAPALVRIESDEDYRRALVEADLAIADSGAMVLLWRLLRRQPVTRISGLRYLQCLAAKLFACEPKHGRVVWVLPSDAARARTIRWLEANGFPFTEGDFYVAPQYGRPVHDPELERLLEQLCPPHLVIGIGGGTQEKLALSLRERLSYRPAIHCVGAALAFLNGDQDPIPRWADKLYLGWLLRLLRQPRLFGPRYLGAFKLPKLIALYGSELPPLAGR